MPGTGWTHPHVVHFVLATLFLGLPIYWSSFLRRPKFLRPLASTLLVAGTVASFVAVGLGADDRGAVEAVPGAAPVVQEHGDLGLLTRNIFAGILLLELVALGMAWHAGHAGHSVLAVETGESHAAGASTKRFAATALSAVVAVAWTVAVFQLYETAERGGEVVNASVGQVGCRTGTPGDTAPPALTRAGSPS
jgi:uncharacterized membrane protein